ncbi:MAG: class I SAM-dependent methyltransferase [Methanomassiliicoccus sp.]|nr:class I SAM-dependent methyltransferase [Methanomassiliicoccus sp.]
MDHRRSWNENYSRPDPMWKGPPGPASSEVSGTVLELGCGNGKTARALVRSAERVVGLDFSRPGLDRCRADVRSGKLDLVEGDVRHLPFSDHRFDHVFAVHVLGHLVAEDMGKAVGEIERVTVPGGKVVVRTFSCRDMRAGKGEEVEPGSYIRGNGILTHYFERSELSQLMGSFLEVSLEEIVQKKRYRGSEHVRAEWVGVYQTVLPMC